MSLYAQYLAETRQREILERDWGFATYEIHKDECYIVDIYVVPEERKKGGASRLADEISGIAKTRGCRWITGSVNLGIKDPTASMRVLLAYGMSFVKADPNIIYFGKELK